MDIQDILKVSKFRNEAFKAEVNLYYTSTWFNHQKALALKRHQLTLQQFNILRILKGQLNNPASVKLITERMIDSGSNVSRIIDRMLTKKLVERRECPNDRRQVEIRITETGLKVVEMASKTIGSVITRVMSKLTEEEIKSLNSIMDKIRTDDF
jgi:DNA-binding MarR family transcriptional regulator